VARPSRSTRSPGGCVSASSTRAALLFANAVCTCQSRPTGCSCSAGFYRYGLRFEYSMAAYWAGDVAAALEVCEQLLALARPAGDLRVHTSPTARSVSRSCAAAPAARLAAVRCVRSRDPPARRDPRGCGGHDAVTIDHTVVETGIETGIAQQQHVIAVVSCPKGIEAKRGAASGASRRCAPGTRSRSRSWRPTTRARALRRGCPGTSTDIRRSQVGDAA